MKKNFAQINHRWKVWKFEAHVWGTNAWLPAMVTGIVVVPLLVTTEMLTGWEMTFCWGDCDAAAAAAMRVAPAFSCAGCVVNWAWPRACVRCVSSIVVGWRVPFGWTCKQNNTKYYWIDFINLMYLQLFLLSTIITHFHNMYMTHTMFSIFLVTSVSCLASWNYVLIPKKRAPLSSSAQDETEV